MLQNKSARFIQEYSYTIELNYIQKYSGVTEGYYSQKTRRWTKFEIDV